MGHLSKTELNLTYFYTTQKHYWLFGKISSSWIRNNSKFFLSDFGEVMWEINVWPLRTQYIFTLRNGHMYVNMASSKSVCTHHNIRRFLRRSLILKIYPNPGQTPGTRHHGLGEEENMNKYERRSLLTVGDLKTLYCCIDSPRFRMNPTHFIDKLENYKITVTHSPHS